MRAETEASGRFLRRAAARTGDSSGAVQAVRLRARWLIAEAYWDLEWQFQGTKRSSVPSPAVGSGAACLTIAPLPAWTGDPTHDAFVARLWRAPDGRSYLAVANVGATAG